MRPMPIALSFLVLIGAAIPAFAEWYGVVADRNVKIAGKSMEVSPKAGWNRSTARPSPKSERWTRDGLGLNELTFFAGVSDGETLYYAPFGTQQELPKFRSAMLPTEVVELFESSNRIILQSSIFEIDSVTPSKLGPYDAVRFNYSYAAQDEGLTRKGEATAAIVGGRLYMVNFIAPAIHYFDRDLDEIRQLVSSIKLSPPISSLSK
ncbi:MAG: hypothetical protein ACRCY3_07065 [Sphingorhabdus sp.]